MTQYSKQVCNTLVSPYTLRLDNVAFCMFRVQRSNKRNFTYVKRRKQLILFIIYKVNVDH